MADNVSKKRSRFLSRLLRDEAGNTIAIMAAAIIPVVGLVGGAVDASRIFLVKTKLQAACDAGSLMGRKVMANGTWEADSYHAKTRANEIFAANFRQGEYGSGTLTREFTESGGNVSGTASAVLPMTLMKALNQGDRTITVTCDSEMRIPNTDVMFVLDSTGSMDWAADGGTATSSDPARITGLRIAVKCFYEVLAKEDIPDVSASDCAQTSDPDGGNSADVSLRFGFVNYSVNVNVGYLLPLDYVADSWTYQSREAQWDGGSGWQPVYGTETDPVETGSSSGSNTGNWNNWKRRKYNVWINGVEYDRKFNSSKSECDAFAAPPNHTEVDDGSMDFVSQSPSSPTYPSTTEVTLTYEVEDESTEYKYEYRWKSKKGGQCKLFYSKRNLGDTTTTFETTRPVTWVQDKDFDGWVYKPTTFDISGLKDTTNNAWRTSLSLPVGNDGTDKTIYWNGCIEERQTQRVEDSDPSDNWSPIPTGAKDMNIDLAPTTGDVTTQWAPALEDILYEREWNGNRTTSYLYKGSNSTSNLALASGGNDGDVDTVGDNCPTASRLVQSWSPTNYQDYINSLTTDGNTYHDIGLLWGARLMSPTGIFAGHNAPEDMEIQRHMIFMTDGDTNTSTWNYTAYGLNWWDRRQNQSGTNPSSSWLSNNVDARAQAICQEVKNMNITLWVVAFGESVGTATEANLQSCATSGKFIRADSISDLIDEFKGIADEISNLRLTS